MRSFQTAAVSRTMQDGAVTNKLRDLQVELRRISPCAISSNGWLRVSELQSQPLGPHLSMDGWMGKPAGYFHRPSLFDSIAL